MNKKIKIILLIIVYFIILLMLPNKSLGKDLDEITDYTITVNPRDDGTLDIKYHIEWKVLDSTTAGPLQWVQIGIPNQHVDQIQKISNNIDSITHYNNTGNFVKINFNEKYYEGDTVIFEYSIHQSYMYTINSSKGKVNYEFTPGWFENIKVDKITVEWDAANVEKHNGKSNNGYIIWSKKLRKGKKLTTKVEYSISAFNLDYTKQVIESEKTLNNTSYYGLFSVPVICFVLLVLVTVIIIVLEIISPSYYFWHGGYGYYGGCYPYYHHHYYYHTPPEHFDGFGGGFFGGGGRRRRRIFLCLCMCMCRRRTSWMC